MIFAPFVAQRDPIGMFFFLTTQSINKKLIEIIDFYDTTKL